MLRNKLDAKVTIEKIFGHYYLLIAFILICLSGAFILSDFERRIAFLADDAFYVTIPAKNFVEYGFPSLDTLNPTNGFHPIIFLVDSILALIGLKEIYIANQIFGIFFLLAATRLFYEYSKRFLSENSAVILTLAFVFYPHLFSASLSGLEATFFSFMLIAFYIKLVDMFSALSSKQRLDEKDFLKLGLIVACCYLGRTEFLVHLAAIFSGVILYISINFVQSLDSDFSESYLKKIHTFLHSFDLYFISKSIFLLIAPIIFAILLFSYFSFYNTGHFMQSSASQKSIIFDVLNKGPKAFSIPYSLIKGFLNHGMLPTFITLLPLLLVHKRIFAFKPRLTIILIASTLIYVFYIVFIPIYQFHYMASFVTLNFILLAPLLSSKIGSFSDYPVILFSLILISVFCIIIPILRDIVYVKRFLRIEIIFVVAYWLSFLFPVSSWLNNFTKKHLLALLTGSFIAFGGLLTLEGIHPVHLRRVRLANCLNEVLPDDVVIGADPAGIYAKYIDNNVINLDGAISWPALEAVQQGQITKYIKQSQIDLILESRKSKNFLAVDKYIQIRESRSDLIKIFEHEEGCLDTVKR